LGAVVGDASAAAGSAGQPHHHLDHHQMARRIELADLDTAVTSSGELSVLLEAV
jgi:hypothetical protein